ncbi:MAG: hypothetical protein AAFU61_18105, partial [Pseudomonadota bacterium]
MRRPVAVRGSGHSPTTAAIAAAAAASPRGLGRVEAPVQLTREAGLGSRRRRRRRLLLLLLGGAVAGDAPRAGALPGELNTSSLGVLARKLLEACAEDRASTAAAAAAAGAAAATTTNADTPPATAAPSAAAPDPAPQPAGTLPLDLLVLCAA